MVGFSPSTGVNVSVAAEYRERNTAVPASCLSLLNDPAGPAFITGSEVCIAAMTDAWSTGPSTASIALAIACIWMQVTAVKL